MKEDVIEMENSFDGTCHCDYHKTFTAKVASRTCESGLVYPWKWTILHHVCRNEDKRV